MQIILLEKITNVGNLGDVVKVKNGYARNFLIPQGKAKRATPENLKVIEAQRAELEAAAGAKLAAAQSVSYTHLDVYKRQVHGQATRPARLRPCHAPATGSRPARLN